ncbi:DNA polymerase III subunit delta [Patescibacteria group bacterium]|nr:DNA polymerase III subunit delta [Patescibacteria group bacterium]
MIIFLYGEDIYNSQQKLKEIKEKFIAKTDPSGINIFTLEGDKFDLEKFNSAAGQTGFLVSKRLLIIKNLLSNKLSKETVETLKDLITDLKKSDNIFIFWQAGKADPKNELFKLLSQDKKYTQEFTLLENQKLAQWIKSYVQKQNGQIDNAAITFLVTATGNDLWQLANELDKLLAFSKGAITVKAAQQLVQSKLDENIFGLIDAIAGGNKALALRLLNEQLNLGLGEIYILSMIIRQFRITTELKSLVGQKLSQTEIAKQIKLHPYVVKKSLPLAKKFTLAKLQDIYAKLVELEKKFKSTSLPPQPLLDLFILQI